MRLLLLSLSVFVLLSCNGKREPIEYKFGYKAGDTICVKNYFDTVYIHDTIYIHKDLHIDKVNTINIEQ